MISHYQPVYVINYFTTAVTTDVTNIYNPCYTCGCRPDKKDKYNLPFYNII